MRYRQRTQGFHAGGIPESLLRCEGRSVRILSFGERFAPGIDQEILGMRTGVFGKESQ